MFLSCAKNGLKYEKELRKNAQAAYENLLKERVLITDAIDSYISSMSIEDQVAQLFMVNLVGDTEFVPVEKLGEKALVPGGYIFFSYNIAPTPEKIISFTDSIKDYCIENNIIPPYLALDQEGGYVCRLKNISAYLPSAKDIASNYSVAEAYKIYSLQAQQMCALGFNLNIAPVVEILSEQNKDFLEDRSFGLAENVKSYSSTMINAFQNNGVACVAKHFPGNTNTDPHTGLPNLIITEQSFKDEILVPFSYALSNNPSCILMSHAQTSFLEENTPACFSSKWIKDVAREKLHFQGLVISDDIFMAALADNGYPEEIAASLALESGVDVIMISEKRFFAPHESLCKKARADKFFEKKIKDSVRRVISFKIKYGILSLKKNDNFYMIIATESYRSKEERLSDFYFSKHENESLLKG